MLKNKVEELIDKYLDEVISIRRYLHQNPELSLKEFNTSEFIVKELNKIGLDAQRGRENNGVVSNLNLGKGKDFDAQGGYGCLTNTRRNKF